MEKTNMTRRDLVMELRNSVSGDVSIALLHQIVDGVLSAIESAVVAGKKVELRDFGVFELIQRQERMSRNPKTGEPVAVPARESMRFRPAKRLRDI